MIPITRACWPILLGLIVGLSVTFGLNLNIIIIIIIIIIYIIISK
jgi:hypothetical protein